MHQRHKTPDSFLNIFPFFAKSEDFNDLLTVQLEELRASTDSVIEWMVHPGESCEKLRALAPNYAQRRNIELALLSDPSVEKSIQNSGYVLTTLSGSFSDVNTNRIHRG